MASNRPARVHLLKRGNGACGQPSPKRHTQRADQVTCEACKRTLALATAELAARARGRRR